LSKVQYYLYPDDRDEILVSKSPKECIIVMSQGSLTEIVDLMAMGFEQFAQQKRDDFGQELLVSSLMIGKSKSFLKNPIPFFFSGFRDPNSGTSETDRNIVLSITKSTDKQPILDRLNDFLSQNSQLDAISDLCVQVADELISNAAYSAPVDGSGNHIFQETPRTTEIVFVEKRRPTFFCGYSSQRVVVGCQDQYGSFSKSGLVKHLSKALKDEKTSARVNTGGAGLGMKYMVENSANFYLYCDPGITSLVACGFLLKGMRANLTSAKHFHMSVR
jgi:hypothetical protein